MTTSLVSPSRLSWFAKVVTEALAPAILVAGLLLAVAWHSAPTTGQGLLWGVLAATFASVIPIGYIIRGVRTGKWTDHHVGNREQRRVPLLFAIASVVVGLSIMTVLQAPREILALVVAMLAGLVVTVTITYWWKISVHAAVAGGTAVILTLVFGPVLLVAVPFVALVSWSRVKLKDHTTAQVIAGAIAGSLVAAVVFSLLR